MVTQEDINKAASAYTSLSRNYRTACHKLAATIDVPEQDILKNPNQYISKYAEVGNAYNAAQNAMNKMNQLKTQYNEEQNAKAKSHKESTQAQKVLDKNAMGDAPKIESAAEKAEKRIDILDIMAHGTSEERAAAKEKKEEEANAAKIEEAAKRKEKKDRIAEEIKNVEEQAKKDVERLFGDSSSEGSISEIKDTIKDAIANKDKDVDNIVSSYKNARKEVKDIMSKAKEVQEALKNPEESIKKLALKVLSNDALLKLQEDILSNKLAEAVTLDNIAAKVTEQLAKSKDLYNTFAEKLAVKKAYISAFISNTFGNPEYMKKLTENISKKVDETLKGLAYEKLEGYAKKLDKKVDSVFGNVDQRINQMTGKIYTKIDTLTKIASLENINKKIEGILSMDDLQKKLAGFPLGKMFSGPILKVAETAKTNVLSMFKGEKFQKVFGKVATSFKKISDSLKKAKDFIKEKTQMIRDYVKQLKDKAISALKEYATKIVSDISSKIGISVQGALGGLI